MYSRELVSLSPIVTVRYHAEDRQSPLTWADALSLLATGDAEFLAELRGACVDAGWQLGDGQSPRAYFLETPPLSRATAATTVFETTFVPAPGLGSRKTSFASFAEYRDSGQRGVASFANLQRDAVLVVPVPVPPYDRNSAATCGHLQAYMAAPWDEQHAELWRAVGRAARHQMDAWPVVWVSTHGLGVPWLHVRVERTPKYISHGAYRLLPRGSR